MQTAIFERFDIELQPDDAAQGSHQGRCDDDIAELRRVPYISAQLDKLSPAKLRDELAEYGAWDDAELSDHEANLDRILWLACGNIRDAIEVTEHPASDFEHVTL